MPRRRVYLVVAAALMLALQLFVMAQLRGPRPQGLGAPPDAFSAGRALEVLRRLLGDQVPHPTGSEANRRVRERLVAELTQLGLDVELHESQRDDGSGELLTNVLACLPGGPSDGRPLVLATHYDSVRAGPGAADAGSCVAALVETARALMRGGPYQRPVYLLITDGEEAGLLGAKAFVREHRLADRKPFVMNFEARGTSGPSLMFETHRGNLDAVRLFARHAARPAITGSSFVSVYRVMPNDTDFTVFQRAGWTGLNFAFIGDAQNYHTSRDNLENLNLASLQHHGENALAVARAVAEQGDLKLEANAEDAVFFDVLGLWIIVFPVSWSWLLAAAPCGVLLARFRTAWWCYDHWKAVGLVLASVVAAVSLAAILGAVITRILGMAGIASAAWTIALYVPLSLAVVWCSTFVFLRDIAADDVWCGFWSSWSLLGVVLALSWPGFSYFLLLPAVGAAILALLPLSTPWRTVGAIAGSATVLLPLANLLPVAFGPRAAVIFHPVFVLVWLPWLPLWVSLGPNGKKTEANCPTPADTPPAGG